MKKSLLVIGLSVALFSCKKTPTAPTLAPSTYDGTSQFTGRVTKSQALGAPNAPFQGVTVTVSIPNSQLYPYSSSTSAIGNSIFSGVTDVNGNYSIAVTTNTSGIDAFVRFSAVNSVYDPIDGTIASFNNNFSTYWFKFGRPTDGGTINLSNNANIGTNVVGEATILGNVFIQYYKEGPANVYSLALYPLAGETVSIDFYTDPTTGLPKTYTATTDAKGAFTLVVTTTNAAGYPDYGNLYTIDLNHTQDTIHLAGNQVAGLPGYYTGYNSTINSLYPTRIINGLQLNFNNFHAN